MVTLIHKSVKFGIALIALYLSCLNGFSQTKVTGHIFAEIVESVSASSKLNTYINVEKEPQTPNKNLGEIIICDGQNNYATFLFDSLKFNYSQAEILFIEAQQYFDNSENENQNKSIQRYKLNGNTLPGILDRSADSNVLSFQVTVVYN